MPPYEPTTLATETLKLLHDQLIEAYADTDDRVGAGLRDEQALESASFRPMTGLGDTYKYESVYEAAAALGHSLVNNHAFVDGNKRTALLSMIAILDRDRVGLEASNADAFDFMIRVAQHELIDGYGQEMKPDADEEVQAMAAFLKSNCRRNRANERRLAARDLSQALRHFGVNEVNPKKGNAIDFVRTNEQGMELRSQIKWTGRGNMTVQPSTVRKIRNDLELDESHGVDHDQFYDAAPPLNSLLIQFRGALDALAEFDRSGRRPDHIAETPQEDE